MLTGIVSTISNKHGKCGLPKPAGLVTMIYSCQKAKLFLNNISNSQLPLDDDRKGVSGGNNITKSG